MFIEYCLIYQYLPLCAITIQILHTYYTDSTDKLTVFPFSIFVHL